MPFGVTRSSIRIVRTIFEFNDAPESWRLEIYPRHPDAGLGGQTPDEFLVLGGHPKNWASGIDTFEPVSRLERWRSPMARKRHSPESIAAVLRRVKPWISIADLARKAGAQENTVHLWKKKYGQLGTAEIRESQRATR